MYRSEAVMAWNVFRFCTALRGLGSIMILLVLGVVGVTYYAVILSYYFPALNDDGLDSLIALAVLLLFHALLAMLLWSYFSVVFTDPSSVPTNWRPVVDEENGDTEPLAGSEFSQLAANPTNARIRFCQKCNQLKPPHCHHCSVCGKCVLKMDHHCVWVVNCVGALNYKYFPLFLFCTFLETTLVTLSLLPNFITFFSDGEIPGSPSCLVTTFLAFVLNLAFALSVFGFLIMHISLVAGNTTTIEANEKKTTPKWRHDLGRKRNFEQISVDFERLHIDGLIVGEKPMSSTLNENSQSDGLREVPLANTHGEVDENHDIQGYVQVVEVLPPTSSIKSLC